MFFFHKLKIKSYEFCSIFLFIYLIYLLELKFKDLYLYYIYAYFKHTYFILNKVLNLKKEFLI